MECVDQSGNKVNLQGIDTCHETALIIDESRTVSIRRIKKITIELE